MFKLKGFAVIEKIYEGAHACIYRAIRSSDQRKVILKIPANHISSKYPNLQLHQEFNLGTQIHSSHVVRYLDKVNLTFEKIALVLDDDGSISLAQFVSKQALPVLSFLPIALELVQGLIDIHQHKIIHRDIKPSNLIIHPVTKRVKYIDFGSSTQLKQETLSPINIYQIEGTLAYISPEQTGRMNRAVDARTDFYSLGVTFYELLTGQTPFISDDPMALIHSHLAKVPVSPHDLKPTIPQPLANIILKLLAKHADERYQSGQGLYADLEHCLKELQQTGKLTCFELGKREILEQLQVPQKLYGREYEIQFLTESFNRVCNKGSTEMVAIAGTSGVGKTALVNELQISITLQQGYFISGKFDQLNHTQAYSALSHALQLLVKQVLTEPEKRIQEWKQKILLALEGNGQLIIELIPALAYLIGTQPTVQTLSGIEAENRFNRILQRFIQVFCKASHPLVLFLDDLQWADPASLNFLKLLMTHADTAYCLCVVTYRDNEVDTNHSAFQTLTAIKEAAVPLQFLTLMPLALSQVNQWIADALRILPQKTLMLSQLVYQKTSGNPFFLKLFLQTLYYKNLLNFNVKTGWQWDLEKIHTQQATDNVIQFMLEKLKEFATSTLTILETASCLGNQFKLSRLAEVYHQTESYIAIELDVAMNNDLLFKVGDTFYFAHDRVQEACYALMSEAEKQKKHLTIAYTLQASYDNKENTQEILFSLVNHFNKAKALIIENSIKLKVAKLNLIAGKCAKEAVAYMTARHYLITSLDYLKDMDIWQDDFLFAFTLHKEWAEVEYLNGCFEKSANIINASLPYVMDSPLHKVELYELLIVQKTMQGKYIDALNLGCQALNLLGFDLPTTQVTDKFTSEFASVKKLLLSFSVKSLLEQPLMTVPDKKAALRVLFNLYIVGYLGAVELLPLIIIKMMKLSLEYGHAPESCMGYAAYGMLLCSLSGDYQDGYEYGQLGIQLSDKFNDKVQKCRSYNLFVNCIYSWTQPLVTVNALIDAGCRAGLEVGELQYVGYLHQCKARALFAQGCTLAQLARELVVLQDFCHKTHNQVAVDLIFIVQMIVENLTGRTPSIRHFQFENITEEEHEKRCIDSNSLSALCLYWIMKSQVLYAYNLWPEALEYIKRALAYFNFIPGQFALTTHNWYYSLILVQLYPSASEQQQADYLQQLEKNQVQMKKWAESCSENFSHRFLLIEAEIARLNHKPWEQSLSLYEQAIAKSQNSGFIQEQALAYELTAKFWLSHNKSHCAQSYLHEAYRHYKQWGASRKTESLYSQYTELLASFSSHTLSAFNISADTTLQAKSLKFLDLSSVLKASQAMSSEIDLQKLLTTVMQILIENAGAQKGAILLQQNGYLCIEAEYYPNGQIKTLLSLPLDAWQNGAHSVIDYVKRTNQVTVLGYAVKDKQFNVDPYLIDNKIKSVLCIPILHQNNFKGLLYLENNLITNAFTSERLDVLLLLASQIAISLENAQLVKLQLQASEQMLKEQEIRLQESQRYQKKQLEFIDTICHEIRNPLNGIYGETMILREKLDTIEKLLKTENTFSMSSRAKELADVLCNAKADLDSIYLCANQQKVIVNDVLDLSKLENNMVTLKPVPLNFHALIHSAVKMFEHPIMQKKLKLDLDLPKEEVSFKADQARLLQVLTNLLSNAVKFTQAGEIYIKLTSTLESDLKAKIHFLIRDTGMGMAPEDVAQLFSRFKQVHHMSNQYEGSGLGLVICKKLVELMGGLLQVESQKNVGTQITFTVDGLPVTKEEKAQLNQALHKRTALESNSMQNIAPASHASHSVSILIAEDNFINQKILAHMLKNYGCTYQVVNNGLEALKQWRSGKFQLIFMDIEMPVMNGLEATKNIRAEEKNQSVGHIPIIGLSGNARPEQIELAINTGMDAYLTKPVQKKDIYAVIDQFSGKMEHKATPKKLKSQEISPSMNFFTQSFSTGSAILLPAPEMFNQTAAALLQQQYSFDISCQDEQLIIQLKTENFALFSEVIPQALQTLNECLEKLLDKAYLKKVQILQNSLVINTASREQAEAIQAWLKQTDLIEKPLHFSLSLFK